jgi:hypothetical protein
LIVTESSMHFRAKLVVPCPYFGEMDAARSQSSTDYDDEKGVDEKQSK